MRLFMLTEKEYQLIGFAGCGQLELIAGYVLSLQKQHKKLLLMDFSGSRELRSLIPLPAELENTCDMVLSYREIDYVRAGQAARVEDFGFEYDVVLADFGRKLYHPELSACDTVCYVTDMCRQNVLLLKHRQESGNRHIVLKHFLKGEQEAESIREELNAAKDNFVVLPYEERELLTFLLGIPLDRITPNCLSLATKRFIKQWMNQLPGAQSEDAEIAKETAGLFWKRRAGAWS